MCWLKSAVLFYSLWKRSCLCLMWLTWTANISHFSLKWPFLFSKTFLHLNNIRLSNSYHMGASAIWHIFFEFKISVIFFEPLGEENIGKLLNEKICHIAWALHAITCLLLTQKMQCFLPFCLTSVLDFREESLKSKQSNAMVSNLLI